MATLLRLGRRVINLDLVFEIEDYGDRLRIFYAVSSSDTAGVPQPTYADVAGREAEQLRAWLVQQAIQLPTTADEHGAERTRAVAASLGPTPTPSPAEPTPPPDDHGFPGVERMRQLHGAGGTTGTAAPSDKPAEAGS